MTNTEATNSRLRVAFIFGSMVWRCSFWCSFWFLAERPIRGTRAAKKNLDAGWNPHIGRMDGIDNTFWTSKGRSHDGIVGYQPLDPSVGEDHIRRSLSHPKRVREARWVRDFRRLCRALCRGPNFQNAQGTQPPPLGRRAHSGSLPYVRRFLSRWVFLSIAAEF